MEHKSFYTKTRSAQAHTIGLKGSQNEWLVVSIHSLKTGKKLNLYKLPLQLTSQVEKIKSYSALVAFAKANQIDDIVASLKAADKNQTPCPAPASTPAKSSEQEQGILFVEVDTVGRGKDAEIIEVSVVDIAENVLFHSRVRPSKPYKDVAMTSPSFAEIWKPFSDAIGRADIAFYNADHSKRMILQSIAKAFDTPVPKHFTTVFLLSLIHI